MNSCILSEKNNFIGPLSFSQGNVKWARTGSKSAHALDGASTASGSITSIKKANLTTELNKCFEGDQDVFADNTQCIVRTTRVRTGGTTPVNVATNVVFIQSKPNSNIQSNENLKPEKWLQPITEEIVNKINTKLK